MISFYNFNKEIRNWLSKLYIQCKKEFKDDSGFKFFEILEQIKIEHFNFYKEIIGLSFLDNYRLLRQNEKYNNLTVEEIEFLSFCNDIKDIDDLFFALDENPSILSKFISGTIKFNRLNIKNQANLLLQTDTQFALNFNKFYLIEKDDMFKERSKDDILEISSAKNKTEEEKILEIINILDVLFIGNTTGFSKLLLEMLQTFYKWKKVVQIKHPELTFGNEDNIIGIVEDNSQDKIIYILSCEPSLIEIIIADFLEFNSFDEETKNEFDVLYNKLVSNEIKIKLKEV